MAEQAIILIPDISGFTEFTNSTEIDHSGHIITELLEIIVSTNNTGFTLAEIEGDAVLFYRKGDPLSREQLVNQCLEIFSNFHRHLMVIEREAICQCGACQTVSNLTLKFITHFGKIKEIKVAQFVKPTGMDMIVAHRLLKNDIASNEYLLITEPCCEALERTDGDTLLEWSKSSSEYSSIGIVNYEVAFLSDYRAQLQPPKVVSSLVVEKGMDNIEIVIHASLKTIYQILINVDKRPEWIEGVDTVKHETTYERINMKHNCKFMGMVIINTVINSDFGKDYAVFSERVEMPDADLTFVVHYELFVETDAKTRLNFNANWLGAAIPEENKQGMMQAQAINLQNLKKICEKTYFNENKSSP